MLVVAKCTMQRQHVTDDLGALALVDEDYACERVRQTGLVRSNETAGLVHVRTQLERLPFCHNHTPTHRCCIGLSAAIGVQTIGNH